MKSIFSSRKGNVVTIYLTNQCLNELSNDNTSQIIHEIDLANEDLSVDMVIFRTIQENFFLKKIEKNITTLISESNHFIILKEKIQNMRPMTVAVVEGTTNSIGSEFIKATDLSYATEQAKFTNGIDIGNQNIEQFSAQKAEDLGMITRYVPSDKIDITLDYLLHTYNG
ncbi:Clp protease/crotonase-like domain-containing protein [Flammeovirga aprica]|uniref:Uncharacterized protein n=1 Tax=Flammeovirga aprica JL-4 TaxID=694437 RepID=A0A7X9S035_9BACT|nr:hypothetical protein [Flammeovirga aprica]NME71888.1 hypothetical protein [Flammeovirga aprica JL-4]